MAGAEGIEPPVSDLESDGLPLTDAPINFLKSFVWSPLAELNCRPTPYHGVALPTELSGQYNNGAGSRIRTYVGIKPTVLQTVPFDRFGIPAYTLFTRCVNNYRSWWSQRWGSNPQPDAYKAPALPLSYSGLLFVYCSLCCVIF